MDAGWPPNAGEHALHARPVPAYPGAGRNTISRAVATASARILNALSISTPFRLNRADPSAEAMPFSDNHAICPLSGVFDVPFAKPNIIAGSTSTRANCALPASMQLGTPVRYSCRLPLNRPLASPSTWPGPRGSQAIQSGISPPLTRRTVTHPSISRAVRLERDEVGDPELARQQGAGEISLIQAGERTPYFTARAELAAPPQHVRLRSALPSPGTACTATAPPGNRDPRPGPIVRPVPHFPRVSCCTLLRQNPGNCTENLPSSRPCRGWPDCLAVGGVRSEPVSSPRCGYCPSSAAQRTRG